MYYRHATENRESITIRTARASDADALRRLAERDSAELPAGELLVAAVGDRLRAAVAVGSGEAIADPFHPTAELVRLLAARATQLRRAEGGRRGRLARLRGRRRGALAPQPAGTLRGLG